MIVHPVLGVFGQPRVLEGLGDLRWLPFVFPAGCVLPTALESTLLPDFASRFPVVSLYSHSSLSHQRGERRDSQATREEIGRRSARPSIRPLLVDGEFPALGVCGGGRRMQATFLGAPSRDKCRVSTISSFQKPKWNQYTASPFRIHLCAFTSHSLPRDDDSTVAQVVLDATDE